jgi:hypothetical protein
MIKNWFIFLILLRTVTSYGVELLITESGNYELGGPLASSPLVGPDTIITISANDVTFDLGGQIVSQGNATAGIDGIFVMPGMRNVTIQNGTMQSIQGIAVNIATGCARVVVQNIVFDRCGRSVNVQSCAGFELLNCRYVDCSTTLGSLIAVQSSTGVLIFNNAVFKAINLNNALIFINGCTAPIVKKIKIYSSQSSSLLGIQGCTHSIADQISVMFSGDGIIMQFQNGSGSLLTNSLSTGCAGGGAGLIIMIDQFSVLSNCLVANSQLLSNLDSGRFRLQGNGIFSDRCIVANSVGLPVRAIGFFLTGTGVLLSRALSNRIRMLNPNNEEALGVLLFGNLQNVLVVDSLFNFNAAPISAAGICKEVGAPIVPLLLRNIAFKNLPQVGPNQYFNISFGAVTNVPSININGSLQTPWTNLSVTN